MVRPAKSAPAVVAKPVPAAEAVAKPAAAQAEEGDAKGTRVVSQKERFLAGTEPHSPSTWGNSWNALENSRVSVGQVGLSNGFLPTARMGARGVVRVSLLGEYLSITDFPVRSAQNIRSAVTFAASFQPFDWGEVFVAYGAAANTNNRTAPNLIQALGDLTFGVKASREWVKGLHAGVDLRLLTFSGVGNQGLDRFAVGFRPTLLMTWDVRSVTRSLPLLLTLNAGVTLDSSGTLVANQRLNASEEFALNINRYHRFNLGVAAEVPLPIVSPFVEYGFGLPLGVDSLIGPDGVAVAASAAMPHTLGLGLKVTAIKDLTLISGVNLGLARAVGLGVAATPPWNFWFGASFAVDPFQRGETKFVETVRERTVELAKAPLPLRIEGTVTDAATKKPIASAVLSIAGFKPSATNDLGQYQTIELTGQKVTLVATRDGYKPLEREVTLEPGKPALVDLSLETDVKKAKFLVTAAAAKKPVKATIAFTGAGEAKLDTTEGVAAPVELELPAGQYVLTANAEGFLSQTREVQVTPGASLPVAFELVPVPKKSLVIFKGDKIEILQQVHFLTGKATILADSFNLLQQVVDAVVRNNVKKITVEGHTDNRGDKVANQALSEARARAVADYLVAQGVEQSRVDATGYGDAKPIAPNLTARGRELNRRVEFIVVEK
jgi:OOP family OmpA-OmpF porin